MGRILRHPPVKFICGVLYAEDVDRSCVTARMEEAFGPLDYESDAAPFTFTDYYRAEMGRVTRWFVAFRDLRPPEELVDAKHATNAIEDAFRRPNGTRRVNLDVGYLTAAKLILATTKDYGHRIYLGRGIFGDQQYHYHHGAFQPMPWTYPDYADDRRREAFAELRRRYLRQLAEREIPAQMYE